MRKERSARIGIGIARDSPPTFGEDNRRDHLPRLAEAAQRGGPVRAPAIRCRPRPPLRALARGDGALRRGVGPHLAASTGSATKPANHAGPWPLGGVLGRRPPVYEDLGGRERLLLDQGVPQGVVDHRRGPRDDDDGLVRRGPQRLHSRDALARDRHLEFLERRQVRGDGLVVNRGRSGAVVLLEAAVGRAVDLRAVGARGDDAEIHHHILDGLLQR